MLFTLPSKWLSFEKAAEFNFLQDLLDDERSERKAEYSDCFGDEDDEDEDEEY